MILKITRTGMNRGFPKAARRAAIIHFNLDGIDNPRQYAATYGGNGNFGVYSQTYITATELHIIHNEWDFCNKTVFYQHGSTAPQPDYGAWIHFSLNPLP